MKKTCFTVVPDHGGFLRLGPAGERERSHEGLGVIDLLVFGGVLMAAVFLVRFLYF